MFRRASLGHRPSRYSHPILLVLLAAAVLAISAVPAAAQAVYGSIGGTVTDESAAVLPGVTVTITSVERKTADTVVTNESGYFLKERLLPGTYEVKAELTGFKTAVVPVVQVSVDTQTPLNFKLARRPADRDGRGHRRIAAAQDRSRRRRRRRSISGS